MKKPAQSAYLAAGIPPTPSYWPIEPAASNLDQLHPIAIIVIAGKPANPVPHRPRGSQMVSLCSKAFSVGGLRNEGREKGHAPPPFRYCVIYVKTPAHQLWCGVTWAVAMVGGVLIKHWSQVGQKWGGGPCTASRDWWGCMPADSSASGQRPGEMSSGGTPAPSALPIKSRTPTRNPAGTAAQSWGADLIRWQQAQVWAQSNILNSMLLLWIAFVLNTRRSFLDEPLRPYLLE